jgi:nitrate/nitrite transporter NarK
VTLESNAIAFPLMMACIGLTMRLGLFLASITHPVIILTASQILAAGTVLVSSFMPSNWLFIVFYGILFGLFAGMSFMIPIYECNNYLVGKKIYVNGVILIGTGCGPIVFGLFSYFYLNPNKLPPLHGYYN